MVGATGFEPTTPWSQARCSTKLSYAPILNLYKIYQNHKLVRLEGFEPPTHGLEGRCSIQLSYRRVKMVGATGFEPTTPWSQARCSTKLSYAPTTQEILCHISQLLSRIFSSFSKARLSSFLHNRVNYTSNQKQMQAFSEAKQKIFLTPPMPPGQHASPSASDMSPWHPQASSRHAAPPPCPQSAHRQG